MASSGPSLDQQKDQLEGHRAAIARSRTTDGACLLPGVVALLGFHIFAIRSGALGHLQPVAQVVFALSLGSFVLSSLLFVTVARGIHPVGQNVGKELQAVIVLFLTGMGALAVGLAGDFFVLATTLSWSLTVAEILAGVVLLALYAPWL